MRFLERLAASDKEKLLEADRNGWIPLHEAARGGHVDAAEFLIRHGSDKNARTNGGKGGSVLWWARNSHDDDHPMIEYLEEIGAEDIEPEF